MQSRGSLIAVITVAAAALLSAGYGVGRLSGDKSATAVPNRASKPQAETGPAAVPQLSQPQLEAPPAESDRQGRVSVDSEQRFTHFRVGNRNVKSIYVDGKVTWVGTSGGVIRYDTVSGDFKLWDARNGLLSNGVFFVGKVRGRITLGTYGGGMSILDEKNGTWETFNVPQGLGDAFVYDVLEASSGDVWIATWSGANRIRGGALRDHSKWDLFTVENTKGGIPNDWIYGLAEGKDGDIWLATEGGLARYRHGKWENWNHAKGLGADYEKVKHDIEYKNDPAKESVHHARQKVEMGLQDVTVAYNPNYIVALEVDRNGVVWAGTWGAGLGRFDGKTWTNYTTAEGLPGNHVFMLHIDPAGRLWVGSNKGLANFNDGRFDLITTADGLFANNVFSMATASDGSAWVGSFGGVTHLRHVAPRPRPASR